MARASPPTRETRTSPPGLWATRGWLPLPPGVAAGRGEAEWRWRTRPSGCSSIAPQRPPQTRVQKVVSQLRNRTRRRRAAQARVGPPARRRRAPSSGRLGPAEAARPAPCSSLQISRLRGRRAGSSLLAIAVAQPAARDMRPPLFALMPGPRGRCLLTPSGSPGAAAAHPASLPLTSAVDFMLISSYKFSFLRLPNDICFS